jgi:hypothetical protein
VAVDLDARAEDSLRKIPQSPALPVSLIHPRVYSRLSTEVQSQWRKIAMTASPSRAIRWQAQTIISSLISHLSSLISPPPRLPVNLSLYLILFPPNKPLLPTVRTASLRSAARPAADRQIVGAPAKAGE